MPHELHIHKFLKFKVKQVRDCENIHRIICEVVA